MIVKINGEEKRVEDKINLMALAENSKLPLERIVIEHNLRIVPRQEWAKIVLRANDAVEILSFMGGGHK